MRAVFTLLKARSAWKGQNVHLRTNARSCTIFPHCGELKYQAHNGKKYVEFEVSDSCLLGENKR
ncbi:hypothetical protein HF325_003298 [Metschnikowia pulcherrima]|uniref:Uncharacterized protein n=1 Tax=Metschnikowia pulcherrima TaxID=27326 RepID=A0A8H7GV80_9ASCO|nr:hypothetical protein HF325_003298 [Metschnikowia pulcherrima]